MGGGDLELLSVRDVAKELGLSYTKTLQLVADGHLPSLTLDTSRRFVTRETLRRFLQDKTDFLPVATDDHEAAKHAAARLLGEGAAE